jgi:hypothetical protein
VGCTRLETTCRSSAPRLADERRAIKIRTEPVARNEVKHGVRVFDVLKEA